MHASRRRSAADLGARAFAFVPFEFSPITRS
jgi:hypothetical protein